MSLEAFLLLLKNRWRVVALFVVAGLVMGALVATLSPREYESSTTLYVSTQADAQNPTFAYQGSLLSEQRVKSYVQLMTSGRVVEAVIRDQRLDEDSGALQQRISVTSEPDTVLLTATVRDRDPDRAASIANSLGAQFVGLVEQVEQPADRSQRPPVAVRIVEPGTVAGVPVSPRVSLDLAAGVIAGLLIGLGGAIARDRLDNKVRSTETLASVTGLPILGNVAYSAALASQPLGASNDALGSEYDSLQRIRANLDFVNLGDECKVLQFASAVSGEGKTTTVCNLGTVLARAGFRVFLIDADLRQPRVADYLNLESAVGLSSVLSGRVELGHAVQRAGQLTVLTSGPLPPNPADLVASSQMVTLVADLEHSYDYVLVDGPPLLAVADATSLTRVVDGVVLVCRADKTPRQEISEAMAALDQSSARVVGAVLTMSRASQRATYGYGYPTVGTVDPEARHRSRASSVPEAQEDADTVSTSVRQGDLSDRPRPSPRKG